MSMENLKKDIGEFIREHFTMFQIETWVESEGWFVCSDCSRTMRTEVAQEKWEALKKKGNYNFFFLPPDLREVVLNKKDSVDFVFTGTEFHILKVRI
jgi:hypothetical protein